MRSERENRRPLSRVGEAFGLTSQEDLFDRVSDARFMEIISDGKTQVHSIAADYNSYGEFLFVTLSRPSPLQPAVATFYGLGFHEHRERWYTNHWSWYAANFFPEQIAKIIPKAQAQDMIEKRRAEIAPLVIPAERSPRARLYEMLAELTDEDGALSELEDLGDMADWLLDDEGGDT